MAPKFKMSPPPGVLSHRLFWYAVCDLEEEQLIIILQEIMVI